MLNEANNVYEEAGRKYAMEQNNEFSVHQNGPQGENMDSIMNQNFLRESIVQGPIDALPTNLVQKQVAHSSCTALSFNINGDTLATGGEDKIVKLWNTKEKKEVAILK